MHNTCSPVRMLRRDCPMFDLNADSKGKNFDLLPQELPSLHEHELYPGIVPFLLLHSQ